MTESETDGARAHDHVSIGRPGSGPVSPARPGILGAVLSAGILPIGTMPGGLTAGPDSLVVAAVLISLLVTVLLWQAQAARRRAAELAAANEVLRREMVHSALIERALRESEQRYRDLTDRSLGYIWVHDFDGRLLKVNPAAAQALGYEPDELLGRPLSDFVVESMRRDVDEYLEVMREQEELRGQVTIRTRSGEQRVWSFSNTRYCVGGEPIHVLANAQDITKLKEVEEELEQARDAAVESARLKSEFLANMSHEIRTPLNGIIGMTDLLQETELGTQQRDYADTIRASADSLLTIVNDILDFSKIEAGMLSFEDLDFGLRNLVESTVEMFAEPARRKKIDFTSLVHSNVPDSLRGDPGRVRQVLTNLIGNAMKFTLAGEVTVRVTVVTESDDHAVIRFAIADTGIGISEVQQKRLFQPFVQADGSTARQFGGTGLGLAISTQLVERMHGTIEVDSQPGVGSTFAFTARLAKPAPGAGEADSGATLEGLRVLIVDDNETNRALVSQYVHGWGMVSGEASSGSDALAALRDAHAAGEPFDIAVMDLMMPGMTGFELARAIRKDDRLAAIRLILMPSFGKRGHASDAREAGISGYLVKPVRRSELRECLLAIVSQGGGGEPAPGRLVTRHSLADTSRQRMRRILIAEDNLVNQKVLTAQVTKLGYRADLVSDGEEALAALSRYPYALVLMDCHMPVLDGYAATRAIREREGDDRHTPIIAVTANAMPGEREKCIAAGMDDYLAKPLRQDELSATVERWIPRDDADQVISAAEFRGDQSIIYKAADITGGFALSDDTATGGSGHDVDRSGVRRRMEELRNEVGGDALGSLVDMFLTDCMARLDDLQELIANGDADGVHSKAHALKGSCLNFGAESLAAACADLEGRGERGDLSGGQELIAEIIGRFETVRAELGTVLAAA